MKTRRTGAEALRGPRAAPAAAIAALSILAAVAAGCSSRPSTRYPVAHVGVAHKLEQGTVVSAREVVVDGEATGLGRVSGAALGGAVGVASAGDGGGQRAIGAAVGGVVGSIVGNEVEKRVSEQRAQELAIRLDSGETIIVVRPVEEGELMEAERIQVYTTASGATRVLREGADPTFDPDMDAYEVEPAEREPAEPVDWFADARGAGANSGAPR